MEIKKVWKSIEEDNYSVVINYIKEQCCRITEYFNSIPRKVMKSCFMVLIGELLHWWYWCMSSVIITAWNFHYFKKKKGGGQLPEVILYKSQKYLILDIKQGNTFVFIILVCLNIWDTDTFQSFAVFIT